MNRSQRVLLIAAASSLLLHLAAALMLRQPSGRADGDGGRRVATMVARILGGAANPMPAAAVQNFSAEAVPVADAGHVNRLVEPSQPAPALPPPMAAQASAPLRMKDGQTLTTAVTVPPSSLGEAGPRGGAGVDQGPRPLEEINPEFPASAGQRGGSVTLRLVISERGEVEKITVVSATPPGLFDEAALAAFGRVRYAPGLRAGLPTRSEVVYQVDFAPATTGTEASGRTY